MQIHWQKYGLKLFAALMLALVSPLLLAATPAQVTNVRLSSLNDATQFAVITNQPVAYKIFLLDNPKRVVIDLQRARMATTFDHLTFVNTPVSRVRKGQPSADILRIVLDLNKTQYLHVSKPVVTRQGVQQLALLLTDEEVAPAPVSAEEEEEVPIPREAVHNLPAPPVTHQAEEKPVAEPKPKPEAPAAAPVEEKPVPPKEEPPVPVVTAPVSASERPIVVVIDPGHGGKDPGARGPRGVREKDIVFAIASDLYQMLQTESGFHPILTRKGDYFVALRKRMEIARQERGDMFIAIHADAYRDTYAAGASVYALSAHGASSEAVRWLAEKENHSELGGVTLDDKSDVLRSVLLDLSQTATIATSLQIGNSLLHQLGKTIHLHCSRVEQAPFIVLKSPDVPSLLLETGFLSNPVEAKHLRDPAYQHRIAKALFVGIKSYYWNNPPPSTLIAALKDGKLHAS